MTLSSFALFLLVRVIAAMPESWRLVHLDGSVEERVGRPTAGPVAGDLRSAWAWSPIDAPRRIEPAAIASFRFAALGDPERLEVRVVRPRGALKPAGGRVIAAPLPAWIDLPESRLPTWPVPRDGVVRLPRRPGERLRIRYAGEGEGSWWVDVAPGQSTVALSPLPAAGIDLALVEPSGRPIQGPISAVLLAAETRQGGARLLATLECVDGSIRAPSLPDVAEVNLTLRATGLAPRQLRRLPSALRGRVSLDSGGLIAGRLVDRAGAPIGGATVEVEAWISPDLPQGMTARVKSGADGTFSLPGLPVGGAVLRTRAVGFAARLERFDIEPGRNDRGTITLSGETRLAVRVRDERGEPITGVTLESPAGAKASTDRSGQAEIGGLAEEPFDLRATADRFRPARRRIEPPFPALVELTMRGAFRLSGRFVAPGGEPIPGAAVRAAQAACSIEERTGVDGHFALDLEPDQEVELALTEASLLPIVRRVPAGAPGTQVDLGDLEGARGRRIIGRLVRAEDGGPIAGGRAWTVRRSASGPAIAWASRDFVDAASDAEGRFSLSGLGPEADLLRVEAPGRARGHVGLAAGDETLDLGDVALGAGGRVHVRLDRSTSGLSAPIARLDLRGDWLEADQLTADFVEGEARFEAVPPGLHRLSVIAGRELACLESVRVPEDGAVVEVDCRLGDREVRGSVSIGGRPTGPGTLAWIPLGSTVPARIDRQTTSGGLERSSVVGAGPPQIDVPVAEGGRFSTRALFPGPWRVVWIGPEGLSPERRMDLPDLEEVEIAVAWEGASLAGVVRDGRGQAVAGAQVREIAGGATALTGDDGAFRLSGLPFGSAHVQARKDADESAVAIVDLAGEPRAVDLVLGSARSATISLRVVDALGGPAGGAFLFAEDDAGGLQILTVDGAGAVTWRPAPGATAARLAASIGGRFGFGGWRGLEAVRDEPKIAIPASGQLALVSAAAGRPEIVAPEGWRLDLLTLLLGAPLEIGEAGTLLLPGLPPGRYALTLLGRAVAATVTAGETARAEWP